MNKSEIEQKWEFEQVDPEVWMTYPPDKQAAYHAWLAGDIFGDDDEPEPERERKQVGGKREGPTIQSLIEQDFIDGGLSGKAGAGGANSVQGGMTFTGGQITHNGKRVDDGHTHPDSHGGSTGAPN